jgi:hypothetical protein
VLKLKLLPGQTPTSQHRTSNPEVYTQYLLGRQFFNRATLDGYRRAAHAYEKAIALDPGFGPAWAGLAHAVYWLADSGETAADISAGQRTSALSGRSLRARSKSALAPAAGGDRRRSEGRRARSAQRKVVDLARVASHQCRPPQGGARRSESLARGES